MLVDKILITVKSGNGGKGCESYEHKSPVKLIPNGGNGGDGGDVIIQAERNISDLTAFKFKHIFEAGHGTHGSSNKKEGKKGKDLIIQVPCGTSVLNYDKQMFVRDLTSSGDSVVVVRGGKGGRGNSARRSSSSGEMGTELQIELDFKFVADVFLVGLANSGKSSLLSKLTGAHTKVTDYPFSTTIPALGVLETSDFKRLVLCEMPSLIEGASEGKGLGNAFLKHLSRATLMVWVLDPVSAYGTLKDQLDILKSETQAFNKSFQEIDTLAVVTKSDLPEVKEALKSFKRSRLQVLSCSSKTGEGIEELKNLLIKKLKIQ